jgi:arginase
MNRRITVVGAPSSIGIRPYDSGEARHLDRAPSALRGVGLIARLQARDLGDVPAPAYRDFVRPPGRVRNEAEVGAYCTALATRVAAAAADDGFALVLGGDCSIVLGSLLGARAIGGAVRLAYFDAHADFASPSESRSGSAASMCLALAVGRGDTPLAQLSDEGPLVRPEHVALVGRRDVDEPWYGHDALRASAVRDLPGTAIQERGIDDTVREVLARVAPDEGRRFWIHFDADVLDPSVVGAVDSPIDGGLSLDDAAALLRPLVTHPGALGLELTIFDPFLDPDGVAAERLASLLERTLSALEA